MAREHARIWLDINADDDFEALPFDAQGFYTRVILTLDDLSYAGVARWLPRKLTTKAPDLSYQRIMTTALALEQGRYCLFDLDTEEVLARSFIRRDELLRNPKFAAAVIKAYGGIASKMLRAVVVDELRRIRKENPEFSSWSHKDTGPALERIMEKPGSDVVRYTNPIANAQAVDIGNPDSVPNTNTQTVPNGNGQSVRNTNPDTGPDTQSDSVPIPSTYTSTSTPAPLGGSVSRERHQGAEPDPNAPTPVCTRHPNGNPTDEPCPGCRSVNQAAARAALKAKADAEQAAAAQRESDAVARAMAIVECDQCDDDGYAGTTVCNHRTDQADTNARGIAAVRAALAKDGDQ